LQFSERQKPLPRLCAETECVLPAYVEGELSPALAERVRVHLEGCRRCRESEGGYRAALAALCSAPRLQAPDDVRAGFHALLRERIAREAARAAALRWAGAAACLLIVGVAGARIVSKGSDAARTEPSPAVRGSTLSSSSAAPPRQPLSSHAAPATLGAPSGAAGSHGPAPLVAPASRSSETGGSPVVTAQATPGADRASAARPRGRRPVTSVAFLDVRDASGRSARELLQRVARHERLPAASDRWPVPTGPGSAAAPSPDRRPVVVAETMDERVRLGGETLRVTGERGVDATGRLALLRVRAEVDSSPDPPETP